MSEAATADPVAAAPAPAASAPAAPSPAPTPPAAPAAPAPSLLAKGATAAPTPAPTPAAAPASPIPAKYHVKAADGSIDNDASMAKWAEGHSALEQRLGAGDAPPKTPQDYAPSVPEGLSLETLKADPLYQGFLKGAHARGMTNAQVSYVLEALAERESMRNRPELAEPELRKAWPTDDQYGRGLADAYRAVNAFAGSDKELHARVDAKFGSDPDFLRLMASIGKELHEDQTVQGALTSAETDTLEALMGSKAYFDNADPQHASTVAKVQALYAKKFPQG